MKEFVFNSCPKDTYRPTHSQKSPEKRDFVVHTKKQIHLRICFFVLPIALSERVRKGAKSEEGTHSEYIFELRKPFIVYGIP